MSTPPIELPLKDFGDANRRAQLDGASPPSSLLPSLSPHSQADPAHRAARRRRSGHVRRLPERLDHESAVEAEPEPRVRRSRPSSSSLRATWSRSARRCAS